MERKRKTKIPLKHRNSTIQNLTVKTPPIQPTIGWNPAITAITQIEALLSLTCRHLGSIAQNWTQCPCRTLAIFKTRGMCRGTMSLKPVMGVENILLGMGVRVCQRIKILSIINVLPNLVVTVAKDHILKDPNHNLPLKFTNHKFSQKLDHQVHIKKVDIGHRLNIKSIIRTCNIAL
jgi:hypothetical protein